MGHVQLTSPILLDDSPPTLIGKDNLSILAEAATHTVLDGDYLEKEYDTPLSVLLGRMKKKKVMSSTSKDPKEGQMDEKAQGAETPNGFEEQGTETLDTMNDKGVETPNNFEKPGTETLDAMNEQGAETLNGFKEQGTESLNNYDEQGTETPDKVKLQGTETLSNIDIPCVENLDDIIMQELKGGQDDFDLDNDGTCLESTAEKSAPKELRMENSTLFLNSCIE